jgi:uncharacterized membrane protein
MRRQDIENLSNLVFGLVLSIVSLILIANPPKNPEEMLKDLLWFTFSFMLVISVWRSYVAIMCEIEEWKPREVRLNILLLLFVGMEPYLFNAITFQDYLLPLNVQDIMNNVGTMLFALDIAIILWIIAIYYQILADEHAKSERRERHYRRERNARIISGLIFAFSAFPFNWSVTIMDMHLRYIIWLVPLVFVTMNMIRNQRRDSAEEECE